MVSDPPEEAGAGAGDTGAHAGTDQRQVDEGGAGLRGVGGGEPREGVEGGNGPDNPGANGATAHRVEGSGDDTAHSRDPKEAGGQVPPSSRTAGNKRYTKTEIAIALREAEGNVRLAARALDCSEHNVRWWIENDTELQALWGGNTPKSDHVEAPGHAELLGRTPENAPGSISPESVDLALNISEVDAKIMLDGLKSLGVSDKTLEKLKLMDGLAKSHGHFLSVSLQKTHQMYFVQLVQMMEVAAEIKEKYLDFKPDPNNPGKFITNCTEEERAWFYKCYTEMVKEAGKGYNTMMDGASAMVRMLMAAKEGDKDRTPKGKPKWHQREIPKPNKPKKDA